MQELQAKLTRESEHLSQKLRDAEERLNSERETSSKQIESIQTQNEKLQGELKAIQESAALNDKERATESNASKTHSRYSLGRGKDGQRTEARAGQMYRED